jgi:transcriptional regulator with XRE-family HTH domain
VRIAYFYHHINRFTMGFSERIKQERTRKGLSQSELALSVGVHYTQIGRYENKGATPAADVLARLANTLEVSSDFLMNGTSQEFAGGMLADKELLNQFRFIEQLPDTDKSVVKVFLDAFITKRQLQTLAL